ncbi:hypothetical protein [Salipiger sp. PrR003]|uniref:hypothetical protein n=1 Tax=Salipiger sp. PrR003 TaxID=2706776 RepID=UPI0013DB1F28|nr:hypothetical protein [Salipiger sp. PrR003]NDV50636.1 hypothetical protein [Salipiger sp. PrR003]
MLKPAQRPKGQSDQNYVVYDSANQYYQVSPGEVENTLSVTRSKDGRPVLHDFSEVHKLGSDPSYSFGRHFSDKRLNGPTFIWEDGDGMFYNPESDCFVPEVDEHCIMTQDEATDALGSVFANDESAQMHQFSSLQIDLFLMKEDPDAEGELVPVELPLEATKFNVIVRVDYMPGRWARAGESDVLEAKEGLDLEYADMYLQSVKQSYPGASSSLVAAPDVEPEPEPSAPRLG